jgi:hypothetical protein
MPADMNLGDWAPATLGQSPHPHPEYTALNSGAHRKPPVKLGAPGLARQINYWIPTDPRRPDGGISLEHPVLDNPDNLESDELYSFRARRRRWIFYVDHFIQNVFDNVARVDPAAFRDLRENSYNVFQRLEGGLSLYFFRSSYTDPGTGKPLRPIFESRDRVIDDDTPFKGIAFAEKVDIEFKDIPGRFETVYLRFIWEGLPVKLQFTLHNEYFTFGAYIDLLSTPISEDNEPETWTEPTFGFRKN